MTNDYYALSPESEARLAAEDYDDTLAQLTTIGVAGLRTGDWTGYADTFAQLQDTAAAALAARRTADQGRYATGGPIPADAPLAALDPGCSMPMTREQRERMGGRGFLAELNRNAR